MKIVTFIGLLALAAGVAQPARADTLRCGNSLIAEGIMMSEVMQKCGEPDSRTQVSEPIRARYPNGNSYVVGTTTQEIWHYQRRSGQFPADLTFEGGVLKRIEFQK